MSYIKKEVDAALLEHYEGACVLFDYASSDDEA
jgi:hypothetical protein